MCSSRSTKDGTIDSSSGEVENVYAHVTPAAIVKKRSLSKNPSPKKQAVRGGSKLKKKNEG